MKRLLLPLLAVVALPTAVLAGPPYGDARGCYTEQCDPYSEYQDPYSEYQDPYSEYQDPYSDKYIPNCKLTGAC